MRINEINLIGCGTHKDNEFTIFLKKRGNETLRMIIRNVNNNEAITRILIFQSSAHKNGSRRISNLIVLNCL